MDEINFPSTKPWLHEPELEDTDILQNSKWITERKKHPLWEDHPATWWSQWLPGCSYQSSQPAIASQKDAVLQGVRVSTKSCWAKCKWWFMCFKRIPVISQHDSLGFIAFDDQITSLFINRMNGSNVQNLGQSHDWHFARSGKVKLLRGIIWTCLNAVSASFWWGRNAWIHNGLGCWISWIHQEPLSTAYQTRDVQRISGIWGRAAPVKILKRAADSPQKLASTHSLFNLTPQPK